MAKQSATENNNVDERMLGHFHGNVGTVRDDRGAQVRLQVPRHLNGGGAAIEDDDLARLNDRGAEAAQVDLFLR